LKWHTLLTLQAIYMRSTASNATNAYAFLGLQLAVAISNVTYTNLKGTSSLPTAVAFDCSGGGGCTDIHVNSVMITGSGGQQTFARCRNAQVATSGLVYPEIPCH
jgi:hypothetical protein